MPIPPVKTPLTNAPALRAGDKVRGLFKSFATTARLMVGVPDYDTYVRHRQDMHPGEPIMSYEDFFRERQDSRYGVNGGKISRCC